MASHRRRLNDDSNDLSNDDDDRANLLHPAQDASQQDQFHLSELLLGVPG